MESRKKKEEKKKKGNEREKNQEADGEDRDHGNSWDARSNGNARERGACFAPVQRWGRTKRVVHQIFIWASVHSLELHYGTKAAENILEEQLNKNVAYL